MKINMSKILIMILIFVSLSVGVFSSSIPTTCGHLNQPACEGEGNYYGCFDHLSQCNVNGQRICKESCTAETACNSCVTAACGEQSYVNSIYGCVCRDPICVNGEFVGYGKCYGIEGNGFKDEAHCQKCVNSVELLPSKDSKVGNSYTWSIQLKDSSANCGNNIRYTFTLENSGCSYIDVNPPYIDVNQGGIKTIKLYARAEDGESCTATLNVYSSDGKFMTSGVYTLTPKSNGNGRIYGYVYSESGSLSGARIVCVGERTLSTTSGYGGYYSISAPNGYYTCTASKDGYEDDVKSVNVNGDTRVDFTLNNEDECTPSDYCVGNDVYHRNSDCTTYFVEHCSDECSNGRCVNEIISSTPGESVFPEIVEDHQPVKKKTSCTNYCIKWLVLSFLIFIFILMIFIAVAERDKKRK